MNTPSFAGVKTIHLKKHAANRFKRLFHPGLRAIHPNLNSSALFTMKISRMAVCLGTVRLTFETCLKQ